MCRVARLRAHLVGIKITSTFSFTNVCCTPALLRAGAKAAGKSRRQKLHRARKCAKSPEKGTRVGGDILLTELGMLLTTISRKINPKIHSGPKYEAKSSEPT